MQIVDNDIIARLKSDAKFRSRVLILDEHPDLKMHWEVNGFDLMYLNRLKDVISPHGTVHIFQYDIFVERCKEEGYQLFFFEDPTDTFDWIKSLNDDPEVSINSTFPGTFKGLLPFQIQGVNFIKNLDASVLNWSTGSGKTVGACAALRYHYQRQHFNLCLFVVKTHNRINTARSIKKLIGLDSVVVDGNKKKRYQIYEDINNMIEDGKRPIVILNYEKFREDTNILSLLVEDRNILGIWDEMPSKLKNRNTVLYKKTSEVLYTNFSTYQKKKVFFPKAGRLRSERMRSIMLSATPIENSPEDWFNCIRMLDPSVYGSVQAFNDQFAGRRNQWGKVTTWKNIRRIGDIAAHIVHQVDKDDPDIAEQFPEKIEDEIYLELTNKDQKIYDTLTQEFESMKSGDPSMLSEQDLLSAISTFQMICNNTQSVLQSARKREEYHRRIDLGHDVKPSGSDVALMLRDIINDDTRFSDTDFKGELQCSKLIALSDLIGDHDGKSIIFTRMNETLIPLLSKHLENWGIDHVVYHGSLSTQEKQDAQDRFKSDPNCKVFLSSDSGSDSIDLEEASLVIHYDMPWTWAKKIQRENRAHRIISTHKRVRFVTLLIDNSVEERIYEILEEKKDYHNQIFKGEISEQSNHLRKEDLIYILTGVKS